MPVKPNVLCRTILQLAIIVGFASPDLFHASRVQAFPSRSISSLDGIPEQSTRFELNINSAQAMEMLRWSQGNFGYSIRYGRISESQFNELKTYYRKTERIAFDPQKEYSITDFLPAKMQALLNRRILVSTRDSAISEINLFYRNSGKIPTTINCWGTALELTRDSSIGTPFYEFMSSRRLAQGALQNPRYSDAVSASGAAFGDVLLLLANVNGEQKLQHAAVHLANGFYFERTDSGSEMFFRIVHLNDMIQRFSEAVDDNGQALQITSEHRRFNIPGKQALPAPSEIFSAGAANDPTNAEYVTSLPPSENRQNVTLFTDDRMGGGDMVEVYEIRPLRIRLNSSGVGEVDPASAGRRVLSAD